MSRLRAIARSAIRRSWISRHRHAFADNGPARPPRLFVDVSVIMKHDARTGIQRVVRSVWSHLAELDSPDFEVVPVYATGTHGYCIAPLDFFSASPGRKAVPVAVSPGDKFLGLDLAAHYLPECREQLAEWQRHGATIHCVVYDLLPVTRPDWFEDRTRQHFSRWLDTVLHFADQALCISDSVADDLRRRRIGTAADHRLRLGRIHLSGDIAASVPSTGVPSGVRAALERARRHPAILMVGTVEPRKCYDSALDAFDLLWRSGSDAPQLIIIGKQGWKTDALQDRIRHHPEHGRRLHWLEDVSDEALTLFYVASRAVFLASYDEGFGLPVVEAANHQRWALVRDLRVFRDHHLPNLRYFSDDSPEALARELSNLMCLAEGRLPPKGTAPGWSWCVSQLLEEIGLAASTDTHARSVLRIAS